MALARTFVFLGMIAVIVIGPAHAEERDTLVMLEQFNSMTLTDACEHPNVRIVVLRDGTDVACVDDAEAAVLDCASDGINEVFHVGGAGRVPCDDLSAIEHASLEDASIEELLQQILHELREQSGHLKKMCEHMKGTGC